MNWGSICISYLLAPSSRKLSRVPPWLFGAADPPPLLHVCIKLALGFAQAHLLPVLGTGPAAACLLSE